MTSPTLPVPDSFHRSLYHALDKLPHLVIRTEDALGPIVTLPVTPATPMWSATCDAVPAACGCRHCGALLEEPCKTATGKVAHDHSGRIPKCSVTGLRQCPWHPGGGNHPAVAS